jgi:hypothetical protein
MEFILDSARPGEEADKCIVGALNTNTNYEMRDLISI